MSCSATANEILIIIDTTLMPVLESGSTKLRIFGVQNPTQLDKIGTGNFKIQTYSKGGLLVDSNDNLGTIGIAEAGTLYSMTSPSF